MEDVKWTDAMMPDFLRYDLNFDRFSSSKQSLASTLADEIPGVQARERCDLLVITAPIGRATTPDMLDVIKAAQTSVLIWRPPIDNVPVEFSRGAEPWAQH